MPLPTWLCGSTPQGEMTAFSRYHKVLEFLSSQGWGKISEGNYV